LSILAWCGSAGGFERQIVKTAFQIFPLGFQLEKFIHLALCGVYVPNLAAGLAQVIMGSHVGRVQLNGAAQIRTSILV
jgi:hypothetical protein